MQFLPPVSYLTYLDRYVIVAYMFLAASILENFVAAYFARAWATDDGWTLRDGYDEEGLDDADARADLVEKGDWIFAPVFLGAWSLLHVVILLGVAFGWFRASWKETANPPDDESSKIVAFSVTRK